MRRQLHKVHGVRIFNRRGADNEWTVEVALDRIFPVRIKSKQARVGKTGTPVITSPPLGRSSGRPSL